MIIIRAESREEWITPLDTEIFHEKQHFDSLTKIMSDSDEV